MENLPLFLKYWAIERSKPDGGIWNWHGNWHGKAIVSSDRPVCQYRSASKIKSHSNKPKPVIVSQGQRILKPKASNISIFLSQ